MTFLVSPVAELTVAGAPLIVDGGEGDREGGKGDGRSSVWPSDMKTTEKCYFLPSFHSELA